MQKTLDEYKEELSVYLKNRMQAIAPNISFLIGEQTLKLIER